MPKPRALGLVASGNSSGKSSVRAPAGKRVRCRVGRVDSGMRKGSIGTPTHVVISGLASHGGLASRAPRLELVGSEAAVDNGFSRHLSWRVRPLRTLSLKYSSPTCVRSIIMTTPAPLALSTQSVSFRPSLSLPPFVPCSPSQPPSRVARALRGVARELRHHRAHRLALRRAGRRLQRARGLQPLPRQPRRRHEPAA